MREFVHVSEVAGSIILFSVTLCVVIATLYILQWTIVDPLVRFLSGQSEEDES